jgi:predicted negative regulator of RcsB-dependent stress response
MLAARQARWDASEMNLDQALALAREIGYPYAEGRVLQTYGELYVKTGDRERARQRFQEALAIFQRVGAKADVEHTSRMLLQLDSE